jgi:cytidylate kinase
MTASKIDMVQYLHERYLERNAPEKDPGPIITISRQMGCPGKKVAQMLQDKLNHIASSTGKKEEWKWVGKEIFEEAAKELDIEPENIKDIFQHPRSIIDQIISAQSNKYYKSDKRILKIVGQVIRSMANDGHVVIVGRGGVALTRDIPKSLHIYLEAPLEWRISMVSVKHGCEIPDAAKYVKDIDHRREQYRTYYQGKNSDYTWFDLRFNCMTLSITEITDTILKLMEIRKLL